MSLSSAGGKIAEALAAGQTVKAALEGLTLWQRRIAIAELELWSAREEEALYRGPDSPDALERAP
jgi:hypothetical protein